MFYRLIAVAVFLGLVMPAFAQDAAVSTCVTDYDASVDYFPDKASVEYATGFTVEYFNNYKLVNVVTPFPGASAEDTFTYVLVQCGTPAPTDLPADALVIEVPSPRIITMSTTFLPHLVLLDALDNLIGVDTLLYINTPEVLAKGTAGDLVEVGSGSEINLETTIATDPTLVMANASGSVEYDAYPILLEAGIPTVINGDYVENDPLGRAEWIKFTALFLNQEAAANTFFTEEATRYEDLLGLTAEIPAAQRPAILWGSYSSYGNAWYIPGAESYVAQLLTDAGATVVLGDAPEVQAVRASVPFDYESVYAAGSDAPIWIADPYGVATLADLLAQDERYSDFAAFAAGNVYIAGLHVNANGGNDIYESGVVYPSRVLSDIIKIAHPDLLPDAPFFYHNQLGE